MAFTVISLSNSQKITKFTSNDTWSKDPRSQYIHVYGCNSGSSGGSGRKGLTTAAGGGSGGANGSSWYYYGPGFTFGTSETVTIGGQTTGGTAVTADTTNGNPGAAGNYSYFGNIKMAVIAINAGVGGTTTTATARTGGYPNTLILCQGLYSTIAPVASSSGQGRNTAGANATNISAGDLGMWGTGGGGGGGADSVTERAGGTGGSLSTLDNSAVITAGGSAGTESGTLRGGDGSPFAPSGGFLSWGTGGGGGGGQHTIGAGLTGGAGGDGGIPGAGGGGGGGGFNTLDATGGSGAGGNGARGEVWVIEIF